MEDGLRGAFEKWARRVGFEDFEVRDDDADDLELEYCNDDVELIWCAFAEGERVGWFSREGLAKPSEGKGEV